jgi:hypothetical protein
MIVVFTPAEGEQQQFDPVSLRVSEASIAQRTAGMKWQDIVNGLTTDDLEAMRVIAWVCLKRSQPSLRYDDFDPGVTELSSRLDRRETELWADSALQLVNDDMTLDAVLDLMRAQLPALAADPEHARAVIEAKAKNPKESEAPEAESDGSSPTPTSTTPETPTSDSSPTSSTSRRRKSTS